MADVTTDIATRNANQATELDALVIGAGFAGLYQLLCLRDRLGLSVKALEVGGGRAARGLDHRLHQTPVRQGPGAHRGAP